ncbi:MAG: hypothetical protein IJP90_09095 [Treponema sp.]|nr:hypothetical protein [Treponema sp.]
MFDAIFLAGRMPLIQQVISIIRENGINCPIVGSDPFDDPLLTENLSAAENGKIFAVSNYDVESEHPRFKEFYSLFKEKFGYEPDQEALQVYDALLVLSTAIEKAVRLILSNWWKNFVMDFGMRRLEAIVLRQTAPCRTESSRQKCLKTENL